MYLTFMSYWFPQFKVKSISTTNSVTSSYCIFHLYKLHWAKCVTTSPIGFNVIYFLLQNVRSSFLHIIYGGLSHCTEFSTLGKKLTECTVSKKLTLADVANK